MALLESIEVPLGSKIPEFSLPDPAGKTYSPAELVGPEGLLLIVTCNHCPYAMAVWPRSIALAEWAKPQGVNTVAINPNINPNYPDDAPEVMQQKITEWQISFPYLVDETQEVARALKAQCTPDIYLYDKNLELVYHGRIDDNWQDESKVTRQDLKEAIENLIEQRTSRFLFNPIC